MNLLAHLDGAAPERWSALARAWSFEPPLTLLLALTAWLYAAGTREWRRRLAPPRGLRRWEVGCFWTGWGTLVVALASPLHPWGQTLFAAHMTQHELLMLVSAPLLVLGRPWTVALFSLPSHEARWLSARWRRSVVARLTHGATRPLTAWSFHALALWVWHVPACFEATLRSPLVHDLQHASFFGSALLFWFALGKEVVGWRGGAAALLYLFTTMLHSGALGALLLFASHPLYPAYAARVVAWGLTPLEDQQLGGLIMWVPAGIVYVAAALAAVASWLRATGRREDALPALSPMR